MKILSIDTASDICGVSILEDTTLIKKFDMNTGRTHSENLMPMIENALLETNLSLKNINLIVCDKGPGSFTGIRIGVATTKAFTDALNIPSIGINSLEALAYNVKNEGIICSIIDGKNNNCYIAIYELSNNTYNYITKPFFANLDENIIFDTINKILDNNSTFSENQITFVGDGSFINKDKLLSAYPSATFSENNSLDSYNLGLAGFIHYNNNEFDDVLPLYLRKPQAQRQLEEESKSMKG